MFRTIYSGWDEVGKKTCLWKNVFCSTLIAKTLGGNHFELQQCPLELPAKQQWPVFYVACEQDLQKDNE